MKGDILGLVDSMNGDIRRLVDKWQSGLVTDEMGQQELADILVEMAMKIVCIKADKCTPGHHAAPSHGTRQDRCKCGAQSWPR